MDGILFKNLKLLFLLIFFGFLLFAPLSVQASIADPPNIGVSIGDSDSSMIFRPIEPCGDRFCIGWIGQYISAVYQYGVGIAAVLAVIMIIAGGFLWLTSAGSPNRVGKAKDYISSALLGLFLALFSFVLLYALNPRLVNLEPLRLLVIEKADAPVPGDEDPVAALTTIAGCCVKVSYQVPNNCYEVQDLDDCVLTFDEQTSSYGWYEARPVAGVDCTRVEGCPQYSGSAPEPPTPPPVPIQPPTSSELVFPFFGDYQVTSEWGDTSNRTTPHSGIDFAIPYGTQLVAVGGGEARVINNQYCGTGVQIDFGNGTRARYCHLSSTNIIDGQIVNPGQVIGNSGAIGARSTGAHLHFVIEVYQDGRWYNVNPRSYLGI